MIYFPIFGLFRLFCPQRHMCVDFNFFYLFYNSELFCYGFLQSDVDSEQEENYPGPLETRLCANSFIGYSLARRGERLSVCIGISLVTLSLIVLSTGNHSCHLQGWASTLWCLISCTANTSRVPIWSRTFKSKATDVTNTKQTKHLDLHYDISVKRCLS